MASLPRELLDAYVSAVYRVRTPRGEVAFTLRPGAADEPPVVLPFEEPWAIITAWNPRSRPAAARENAAAAARLLERLDVLGVSHVPAVGGSPGRGLGWREEGVLLHAATTVILGLLREFDQHAAVFGEGGRVGLLLADRSFIATGAFAADLHGGSMPH